MAIMLGVEGEIVCEDKLGEWDKKLSQRWSVGKCSQTERPLPALTLIVPSANSVSPLKISVANRLIHTIHKNCIVYLFL